ncbi:outer membrane protein assembly factor BamB family protein, partial [Singulisphaera rosea]
MSRKLILWSSLIWASLAPVAWSQTPFTKGLVPTRSALGRVGLEQDWMAAIPLVGTERLAEVSIADTLLFAQTNHANFYTYDAETGRLLWSATLGKRTGDVYPASANSRLVFVTNSNSLFALDRQTGRVVWTENLSVLPTSPTICDEERVAVGLNNGLLRGFDLRILDNKNVVKKDDKGQFVLAPKAKFAWNWQTGGALSSRALFAGKLIAFGGHDGKLYVTMTEEAKPVYRFPTGGSITSPLAYHGTRTLLVPSEDGNVYAIDLFTGVARWIFSAAAPVMQAPLVVGDDAYIANTAGILYAVDANTGS